MPEHTIEPAPLPVIKNICIIEEHDDYIVIGIPIQKSSISDAMPFLSAVSERTTQSGTFYAAAAAKSAKPLRKYAMRGAAMLGMVMAGLVTVPHAIGWSGPDRPEPVEIFAAKMMTPNVAPLGSLCVMVTARRNRLCPQYIDVTIARTSDRTTVFSQELAAGHQAVTELPDTHPVCLDLPRGLTAQEYNYRRVVYNICDGVTHDAVVVNDMPFTVTQ